MSDKTYVNLPESRRKAIILWEMFGRPMGEDGIRILQQAIAGVPDGVGITFGHMRRARAALESE